MARKGIKYVCKEYKGFISRARYRRLPPSKKRQCRVVLSKGRPRKWRRVRIR